MAGKIKHWYIRYSWSRPNSGKVVSIAGGGSPQKPDGGEGWGVIDIHPFKWIKVMREQNGIFVVIHYYQEVTAEEQALFKEIFAEKQSAPVEEQKETVN